MRTDWFRFFEVIGTLAFAISGVLIARRERYDISGACVLAALPAIGGGFLRDLICGRSPVGFLRSPEFLIMVLATVGISFVLFAFVDFFRPPAAGKSAPVDSSAFRWLSSKGILEISDAIGMATFVLVGVVVAIEQRCEPLWLWGPVMAALTASGGGVLRDVLRSKGDLPTLKGSIYPEIAVFWGLVYSLVILAYGAELNLKEVLLLTFGVIGATFLTRLGVVHFGIQSVFLSWPTWPNGPKK